MSDSTLDALLQNILQNPADDECRLIYADRLDDLGQGEHAEFVRVQIELALWGTPTRPRAYGNWYVDCRNRQGYPGTEEECCAPTGVSGEPCEYHALRRRETELLTIYAHVWCIVPFSPGATQAATIHAGARAFGGWSTTFRRGFVEIVTCPSPTLVQYADALFAAAPITRIILPDQRERIEIDPPGADYGWQAYAFRDGEEGYYTMNGWDTREEMIRGIQAHYRPPEGYSSLSDIARIIDEHGVLENHQRALLERGAPDRVETFPDEKTNP